MNISKETNSKWKKVAGGGKWKKTSIKVSMFGGGGGFYVKGSDRKKGKGKAERKERKPIRNASDLSFRVGRRRHKEPR